LFDETQKADRKFGYYKTDGTLAFVEKIQYNYSKVILKNATNLSVDGGKTIVENGKVIKDIGIKNENHSIEIDVKNENDIDVNTFKFYSEDKVNSVTVNGRSVYFEQRDNYIYLKETGLPEENTSTGSGSSSGSDHSAVQKPPVGGGSEGSEGEKPENPEINTPGTENDAFPDIKGHWAKEYIAEAKAKNIITGDEKGNFNPDNSVTRAELIAMLMRTIEGEEVSYDGIFSDVDSDDWYASVIAKALKLGIISEDTKFRPNDRVTREEMCKMIVNVYTILGGEADSESDISFADGEEISPWAEEFVKKAVAAGLMNGMDENKFSPGSGATRAQAATVICRMLAGQSDKN